LSTVVLSHATVTYKEGTANEIDALSDLDLSVQSGDFISILGSNGSGKTTLLKTILGTVRLTRGEIWVDGERVTDVQPFMRSRKVAMVHQTPGEGCAPEMTVEENLALALLKGSELSLRFWSREDLKGEILSEVDQLFPALKDKLQARVSDLSGGQRQALALAMGVVQKASILLLDEHTAALSPENRTIINELTQLVVSTRKITTLMVSHRPDDAVKMGSRLLFLNGGKIVKSVAGPEKEELTPKDIEGWFRDLDR
jgi:putative ABC transport system ATP-binding protein